MKHLYVLGVILALISSQGILAQCDAGDDAVITVCANDDPLALFDELNGAPITGGYWLDPADAPFAGTFDPAAHAAGTYTYIVENDLNGIPCNPVDSAFLNVVVASIPTATFDMDNNEACGTLNVQFTNTTLGPGFTTCTWDFGDGSISTVCNPLHTFTEPGCYDIIFTTSNGIGCTATDTVLAAACVKEEPVADFDLEENPVLTSTAQARFINNSENAVTFEWIIPDVGNFNEEAPVVQLPNREGTYFVCLEVMAANGCTDTHCSNVLVRDDVIIYVPTAFTPNQDRVNETFKPHMTFVPERYELLIFDRWGTQVFRSDIPAFGWNGTGMNSQYLVPDGYYSYRIKAVKDAEIIERVGQLLLLR